VHDHDRPSLADVPNEEPGGAGRDQ
jgi:hypothetical protein